MDDATLISFCVQITADSYAKFNDWQVDLQCAMTSVPDFLSLEITTISPLDKSKWRIVLRFKSATECAIWKNSEPFIKLVESLKPLLSAQNAIEFEDFERLSSSSLDTKVTQLFITEIRPGMENEFRLWSAKIHHADAQFPGFCGVYVQAPTQAQEGLKHWITFLQFDSQENLDRWLDSPERQQLLKEASSIVASLEYHRVISSYPGWFHTGDSQTENIPLWKQGMLVLMMLFPVVMLESKFLSPLTASLNFSIALFIGNFISVSLVTWPLMPLAIRRMNWWLNPDKNKKSFWISFKGVCLIFVIYFCEVAIFL